MAPIIREWAGSQLVSINPSGSFAKGTANASGTDIDLFISLAANTTKPLKEIYGTLANRLQGGGYTVRRQNVSLNIRVGSIDVDLVPAKRQDTTSEDHSLYRRKADSWTKTNVIKHIAYVRAGGRVAETRILKLWRDQQRLDFPSFYLEMVVIAALVGRYGTLSDNVWTVFTYLRDSFAGARFVDPANTNNVISDDLTVAEKTSVKSAAARCTELESDRRMTWSLQQLLASLHDDIERRLGIARQSFGHPGTKGDASEQVWLELLQTYLPARYQAARAHVVDSNGGFSQQIDVLVFDRQYSPLIFEYEGQTVIPAESVYAVFEAKQSANASVIG